MAELDPVDRDAYARLQQILNSVGLSSLAAQVLGYVQEGMTEDSIMLELQGTREWKTRFAANERRRAAGLSVLTPAEYLATERAYRQIMSEAGVPPGFWDQTSDFEDLLSRDVSPAEVQGRVKTAADFVRRADPQQLALMKQWYTEGDLIAYALDSDRAEPLVGRAFQAATVAGIAQGQGIDVGRQTAERLAEAGLEEGDARQAFGRLGQDRRTLDKLSGISGESALTGDQLAEGTFLGDSQINTKVERLKSAERGRFAGTSGVGAGSLSKQSSGL